MLPDARGESEPRLGLPATTPRPPTPLHEAGASRYGCDCSGPLVSLGRALSRALQLSLRFGSSDGSLISCWLLTIICVLAERPA